jgi:hypothetical protein
MSQVKTTATEFATAIVNTIGNGRIVHIHSEKTLSLKKGFTANVTVVRHNEVQIGCDYAKVVNDRAEREGVADTVELEGLPPWAERVNKHVIRHATKGSLYLNAMPVNTNVSYYLNGELVKLDDVKSMLYSKDLPKKSSKPNTQGELGKVVKWRRYGMDDIVSIKANGTEYKFQS